jgi:adenosylmethionine---8-amino-7-oxononanoate aminotransferase
MSTDVLKQKVILDMLILFGFHRGWINRGYVVSHGIDKRSYQTSSSHNTSIVLEDARSRSTVEHLRFDRIHNWHPYTSLKDPTPVLPVSHADGTKIFLEDGSSLLDGMSSWWAAVWGYNHPALNNAAIQQIGKMSHVMFGGLTHRPATELTTLLLELLRANNLSDLNQVFYTDSGSVAVEVALKMAVQYWRGVTGRNGVVSKTRMVSVRGGYHGDTFGAMSVCDPINGMHAAFGNNVLAKQIFVTRPPCDPRYTIHSSNETQSDFVKCRGCTCDGGKDYDAAIQSAIDDLEKVLHSQHGSVAAVILEPLVQGAGGMRFYSTTYLQNVRQLCDTYNVLLICDEIATGFGRSGNNSLFACQEAKVVPDILCLGKALTGGYMTLGAVVTSEKISHGVSSSAATSKAALPLMHGPTFMANPLACSVAAASLNLMLLQEPHINEVPRISGILHKCLQPAVSLPHVMAVRVRGAIGVIELDKPFSDPSWILNTCKETGVWLRPFGHLLYTMPPYIMPNSEVENVCGAMLIIAERWGQID